MQDLLEAIQTHWDADPSLQAQLGSLWHGRAPAGTAMPYAVLVSPVTDSPEFTSGKPYVEISRVQFSVFAAADTQALALVDAIQKRFDLAKPAVAGAKEYCIEMRRIGSGALPDGNDEAPAWHAFVEYRVSVGKSLG
jgi:hypothetical protein